ncbi:GA module-containing protein, partial [Lentilactobacillus parakefiri]
GLTSLNPAQITAEKQLINQATTRTDVAQKLAAAKELNNAMKTLRDGIHNKDDVHQQSNYFNEDEQPKQNYDTAIQSGQEIINKSQD